MTTIRKDEYVFSVEVEKTQELSDNTEVAEAPKKGRRPNRGSKAKSRKTTKKKAENEE